MINNNYQEYDRCSIESLPLRSIKYTISLLFKGYTRNDPSSLLLK